MNKRKWEVSLDDLVWKADPKEFTFSSTADLQPPLNPIDIVKGQNEAKEALLLSIKLRQNAILIGPAGSGKSLLAKTVAEHFAKENANKIRLYDQILVYNIENEFEPDVITLPTPLGKEFSSDFRHFMKYLKEGYHPVVNKDPMETPVILTKKTPFSTTTYTGTLKNLVEGAKAKGLKTIPDVTAVLQKSNKGMLDTPILVEKNKLLTLRQAYSSSGYECTEIGGRNERHMRTAQKDISSLLEKYKEYPKVIKYMTDMGREYLEEFLESKKDSLGELLESPHIRKMRSEKYTVNVIVNNAETNGVPVEYIESPSIQNIIGEAGHDAYNMRPMHMRVKAGKFHRGNGGIVIIDELITVFQDIAMRNFLLTVLNDKKGRIGGGHGLAGGGTSAGIETKPIDADCIVIGCANEDIFQYMTDKTSRRFQHKVQFQSTMDNTLKNRQAYADFIAYEINKHNNDPSNQEKLVHYSPEGVAAVIEWGVRFAQNTAHGKKKLTNILDPVGLLAKTASMIASNEKKQLVGAEQVDKAKADLHRLSTQKQKQLLSSIEEGLISINVAGKEKQSVNGLVVIKDDFGLVSYGFPSRMIGTASHGETEFLHLDKESNLAGKILSKAHAIIRSYFNVTYEKYLMEMVALSVSHAQSYHGIEGDSASIAETIALKSALSGLPINQGVAMTGSMNELGEVQPIGGANEKVEGFYAVCKLKGLTGEQGVIIPKSNVHDLMLPEEIRDAVRDDMFHVYAVKSIDEVVELSFDRAASEVDTLIKEKLTAYWENNVKKN